MSCTVLYVLNRVYPQLHHKIKMAVILGDFNIFEYTQTLMEVRSRLLYSLAHDSDSKQQQSGTVVGFTTLNLLAILMEFFTLCRVVF